jgi:peptidylprolyl isomerase
VSGYENTRRIIRGEPPSRPTPIVRMRIAADIPAAQRPNIEVMRTDSPAFAEYVKAAGLVREDGFVRNLCAIRPPRRIDGKAVIE